MPQALERLRARTDGYTVTPRQYAWATYVALGALTLIVLTGAAVRLSGSGLGCPDWPSCYGKAYPPLNSHAVIEFSNRLITGPVSIAAIVAWVLAYRRRPYRRDLVWISLLLPVGVLGQAILGGLTVKGALDYGWVMAHFAVSMLLLAAAWALAWRASREPAAGAGLGGAPASAERRDPALKWGARLLVALGALTLFAGTAATAAGPHAGGSPGQRINRLAFDGRGTMDFVIHRHAEVAIAFGVVALALWWLAYERDGTAGLRRASTVTCALILVQGIVGAVQYETHLPTELVWVHVALACFTWLACLWALSEEAASGTATQSARALGRASGAPAPVGGLRVGAPQTPVEA